MVPDLMACGVDRARDFGMRRNVVADLKEGGRDVVLAEDVKNCRSGRSGTVVKRERNRFPVGGTAPD
jgi:hypothetical protein